MSSKNLLIGVSVCVHVCFLPPYLLGDQVQVVRIGSRFFDLLIHLAGPRELFSELLGGAEALNRVRRKGGCWQAVLVFDAQGTSERLRRSRV